MILSIVRKELKSMFASPMGWIVLAIFTFLFGTLYLTGVNNYFEVMSGAVRPAERTGVTQSVGQIVYGWAFLIVLVAVPLLSMRLISEERRSQTLPFLFSAPLSITEIVIGKFFGLVIFLSILVAYIALMLVTLNIWADIDFGYIAANSLGLFFLIAGASAVGLYFSSLTSQPVAAAVMSFVTLIALIFMDRIFAGDPSNTIANFALMKHFQSFSTGLIDTADIAYFVLLIITFLTLTIRRLDADRLRG
jgi:ABC-2 type transport system permease protein